MEQVFCHPLFVVFPVSPVESLEVHNRVPQFQVVEDLLFVAVVNPIALEGFQGTAYRAIIY